MMDAFSVMRQIILKELRHLSMKITMQSEGSGRGYDSRR